MPTNYIKKYNAHLELNHLNEKDRLVSLKAIFDRDIGDNAGFKFNSKIIRPLKKEDKIDVESLFKHLTYKTEEERDNKGKVIKSRDIFDFERSKRLHWILPHIEKSIQDEIIVFSANNRVRNRDVIRTYIHNTTENYIVILEPQRSGKDYYFITAYYLEKQYGGLNVIKQKFKNKLDKVH
ncbi:MULTISPECIES: hypothetical protein [unclassified Flavobacterium]|uniref:hypothetical protein n=1 Tax=unclassified Flavobacterium TaxID=196869 RepID=UPI0006ABD85C|nr:MULTISPECIES: hypothetical protein [unclassified Flavobacterium]KOP38676.1 hypothetical protein AKO67_08415 [Flavobacterium sp. VMW]OWU90787.1 hypothetical protein APR43_09905 [Flavobacterium sp. NLM]